MKKSTKNICFTAMFAAMVFALTMLHIPIGTGYIHVGDSVIYIVALLLGGPWAFLSAAIGAVLADVVSGYAVYAIPSLIVKSLIAVPFVLEAKKSDKLLSIKTALFTVLSGAITVLGYYIAELIIYGEGAIGAVLANVVQAAGSAVVFIVLAFALDKSNIKKKFKEEMNK